MLGYKDKENEMKDSKELLQVVLDVAEDKLAQEIVALDVRQLTSLSDYFVVMHGKNEKQVEAIVDAIDEAVSKAGFDIRSIEGKSGGKWILMDLNDVVVHVFYQAERSFYNLEKLWHDAPIVNVVEA